MGFTDWIINLSQSKFVRRFQYEPHIIKSVEFVNPKPDENILVVYNEVDYFQSLAMQYVKEEHYFAMDVTEKCEIDKTFHSVVLFFSIYDVDKEYLNCISDKMSKRASIYVISYLNNSKLFEVALKMSDKKIFNSLEKEKELFDNKKFELIESKDFKKEYMKISKYKIKY